MEGGASRRERKPLFCLDESRRITRTSPSSTESSRAASSLINRTLDHTESDFGRTMEDGVYAGGFIFNLALQWLPPANSRNIEKEFRTSAKAGDLSLPGAH